MGVQRYDRRYGNRDEKVKSLDGIFHIIDTTTDKIVLVTDKIVEGLTSLVVSLFQSKKKPAEKTTEVVKRKEGK